MATDLTPSQLLRLARVSSEAFEALRLERARTLSELRAEGVSLSKLAAGLGVVRSQVVQWMRYTPPE